MSQPTQDRLNATVSTVANPDPNDASECPVCGHAKCECPAPLGECVICRVPLYETDAWVIDRDGDHWCMDCCPGKEVL